MSDLRPIHYFRVFGGVQVVMHSGLQCVRPLFDFPNVFGVLFGPFQCVRCFVRPCENPINVFGHVFGTLVGRQPFVRVRVRLNA